MTASPRHKPFVPTESQFAWRRVLAVVAHLQKAFNLAPELAEGFIDHQDGNPTKAMASLPTFIRVAQSACRKEGGAAKVPLAEWFTPLLRCYGDAYFSQTKKTREGFLRFVLSVLDGISPLEAQMLVKTVREPLLAGDIVANRPGFWPAIADEIAYLRKHQTTYWLSMEKAGVIDSFWMCLAVMCRDINVSTSVLKMYTEEYAHLMNDTLDFAATYAHVHALRLLEEKRVARYDAALTQALERVFEQMFRNRIRTRAAEQRWLILGQ